LVIAGVTAATLVVHLGSVMAGRTLDEVLPERVLLVVVGLSFFGFAAWSLRGDSLGDKGPDRQVPVFGAFGVVAGSFFLAELGHKTQLATVTLAGDRPELVAVWLGSTAPWSPLTRRRSAQVSSLASAFRSAQSVRSRCSCLSCSEPSP
jgi:Ca2+/H+ antiporter, TMEM165/GDT1 family